MKPRRRSAPASVATDAELLRAIAGGDPAPLGVLYDRHARDVWRAVRWTLADPHDVEDVVHATFLGLQRSAATYDGRASCRNWLCGIGVNLALRRRRGVGRFQRMLAALAETLVGRTARDPEREASSRQELHAVRGALAALSEKKRAVFVLVELEGLSAEEAGRALHIPAATARTRLFHARKELQEELRRAGVKP